MGIAADALDQFLGLLRPLQVRIANSIARAVVHLVDDAKKLQMLQLGVLEGEDIDDCERFQEYGFTSVPLAGAEAVVVFPNGDRSHPLVVAVDDRTVRLKGLAAGEVAIYNNTGARVIIKANGEVLVDDGSGAVALATKADLQSTVTELKKHFDTAAGHTHTCAAAGQPSSPPIVGTGVGTGFLFANPSGTTVLKGK